MPSAVRSSPRQGSSQKPKGSKSKPTRRQSNAFSKTSNKKNEVQFSKAKKKPRKKYVELKRIEFVAVQDSEGRFDRAPIKTNKQKYVVTALVKANEKPPYKNIDDSEIIRIEKFTGSGNTIGGVTGAVKQFKFIKEPISRVQVSTFSNDEIKLIQNLLKKINPSVSKATLKDLASQDMKLVFVESANGKYTHPIRGINISGRFSASTVNKPDGSSTALVTFYGRKPGVLNQLTDIKNAKLITNNAGARVIVHELVHTLQQLGYIDFAEEPVISSQKDDRNYAPEIAAGLKPRQLTKEDQAEYFSHRISIDSILP